MTTSPQPHRSRFTRLFRPAVSALLAAAALTTVAAPASATIDEEGGGGYDNDDPIWTPPPFGFRWNLPDRSHLWADAWHELGENKPWPVETYNPDYVNPTSWAVDVNGCQSEQDIIDEGKPTNASGRRYQWFWNGLASTNSADCDRRINFPTQGHFPVVLKVTEPNGAIRQFQHTVQVKDLLIVVIGDSMSSGEGAPDVPGEYQVDTDWVDDRCHRSMHAGGYQAASRYERDYGVSVTFLSFACSGATFITDWLDDTGVGDPYELRGNPTGTGIVGPYEGIEPVDVADAYASDFWLQAQTRQLADAITNFGTQPARPVASLIASGGINDFGFSKIIATCTFYNECYDELVNEGKNRRLLPDQIAIDATRVYPGYSALDGHLAKLPIGQRLALEYPGFFNDEDGDICNFTIDPTGYPTFNVIWDENDWLRNNVAPFFNATIAKAASDHGFTMVDGVDQAFFTHGMCAEEAWFNTYDQSFEFQGDHFGSAHPNRAGYQALGNLIYDKLRTLDDPVRPTLLADDVAVAKNTTESFDLSANDHDPNLDRIFYYFETDPKRGAASLTLDGMLTYTPQPGFVGSDSFITRIVSDNETFFVTVDIEVYEPWMVGAQVVTLDTIALREELLNGLDVPGGVQNLSVELVDKVSFGSATTGADTDRIWYTAPLVGEPTPVTIAYRLRNETGWSRLGYLTVTVNPAALTRKGR